MILNNIFAGFTYYNTEEMKLFKYIIEVDILNAIGLCKPLNDSTITNWIEHWSFIHIYVLPLQNQMRHKL